MSAPDGNYGLAAMLYNGWAKGCPFLSLAFESLPGWSKRAWLNVARTARELEDKRIAELTAENERLRAALEKEKAK